MFKKLYQGKFGLGGKNKTAKTLIEGLLTDLLDKGGFSLSAEVKETKEGEIFCEIFGEDEGLLKMREGRFLLALQTYLNRVAKQNFEQVSVQVDSGSFFAEKEQRILDLAERLKEKALSSGRPVYLKKALSPFQRRKVHQFLEEGGEVQTSSVGEGFYKNICISPRPR